MKVLQISTTGDRSFLHEQIRELEKRGVECDTVFAYHSEKEYLRNLKGIKERLLPKPNHSASFYALSAALLYPKVLNKVANNSYDLIHVNSGLAVPFAILQPSRPLIISFWGSDIAGDYLQGYSDIVFRKMASHASEIIVMNEHMAGKLPGNPRVIPHGVDLSKFSPMERNAACEKIKWNCDKHHVLFPYKKTREEKQYSLAEDVVANINKEINGSVVLHTLNNEPHSRMPLFMSASDALLLTSKHEGSPNTVKEALACNLPVIATDVGDVSEQVAPVTHSYVCSNKTELKQRLSTVLRSGSRSDGRDYVDRYSRENMGEKLLETYHSAIYS